VSVPLPGGPARQELLADRELAEDHELLVTLKRFDASRRDESTFAELATDIGAAVRRHVEADAEELLPVLPAMAPIEDLIRVGQPGGDRRGGGADPAAPVDPGAPAVEQDGGSGGGGRRQDPRRGWAPDDLPQRIYKQSTK